MKDKKDDTQSNGMVIGMCLGLCFGTTIGVITGNIGLWMPLGHCIGMCVGIALDNSKKKTDGESENKDVDSRDDGDDEKKQM